jgi:succinoglycan biosynthesis transport protein ExoP
MADNQLIPVPGDQLPSEWSRSGNNGWPMEPEGAPFDWRRSVSAMIRYKWIIVFAGLLGMGAAWLAWNRVTTGLWAATGSLWLQQGGSEQGPIVTDGLLQTTSWIDLIESNSVIDSVVMQERLYVEPSPGEGALFEGFTSEGLPPIGAYALSVADGGTEMTLTRNGVEVQRARPGEALGGQLGFSWVPPRDSLRPGRQIAFTVREPREAAQILQGALTPSTEDGIIISLRLVGADSARIASTLAAVMDRHVKLAADLKSGHLREQTQLLEVQLNAAAAQLEDASQKLTNFRVQTIRLPTEQVAIAPGLAQTQGPVMNEFFAMRVKQEQVRTDRERLEQVIAGLSDSAFPLEDIELIPSVTTSAQLTQSIGELVKARLDRANLLNRYTENHADVIALTGRIRTIETQELPALLRQLVGTLKTEESILASRIEASGADLTEIPVRTIQEEGLRLSVELAQDLYTSLSQRYQTTKLAQQTSLPDVRILDQAVVSPLPRAADRRALIAAALFVALVGAGMAGTVVVDRMDPHMRSPEEVATVLGLTVLGVIPRIHRGGDEKEESKEHAREAFRQLRTNLEFAYGSAGPMVLTVSSPGMSEGKTLVTSNLGMCLAELGRRTLIIDGDTRRGDLHRALNGERKPGLTDYLRGKCSAEEVVQGTHHPNLHFVSSGTQVANSPELLSSPRMGELMAELRKRYDVVLMDSPPLGVGADALVLGCLCGNLLVLLRSDSTHKDSALARMEPLGRLPLRVLGAVMNDYQPDRIGSSHYSTYYGNYLPGYEARTEDEEPQLVGREQG